MPRTTHPKSRHRHGRAQVRHQRERIIARRLREVRHEVDRPSAWSSRIGQPAVRVEDYLTAQREETRLRRGTRVRDYPRLNEWTWVRLRQLADRRPWLHPWDHGEWRLLPEPSHAVRRTIREEVEETMHERATGPSEG